MWLRKIHIENFRSIENCEVELAPGFNSFFGQNGTGKSNLVRAVLKLLGPTYPSVRSFPKEDCLHQDESKVREILLTFEDKGQSFEVRWGVDSKDVYHLTVNGQWPKDDERLRYCPLYLPANREIREMPGANTWNPIGRILSELAAQVSNDSTVMAAFAQKAQELNQVLEGSAVFSGFKTRLKEYASAHLGRGGDTLEVLLSVVDPQNALRTAQIFEKVGNKLFNASDSGLGIQNSITIAALRAFSDELGGRLFVMADEPEAFLHPLSQDALMGVFEKIVRTGTQVIVTTHSPHFVSPDSAEGLHKVWLDNRLTKVLGYNVAEHASLLTKYGVDKPEVPGILGRLSKQLTIDAREGLFARGVVVCEGESEVLSLPVWAHIRGVELAAEGLAVVQSHGKFSMGSLAAFYLAMGMPVFLVFDSDSTKVADRAKHAQANRGLLALMGLPPLDFPPAQTTDRCAIMTPDFERTLRSGDPDYSSLEAAVNSELGLNPDGSKGVRARYVALRYASTGKPPPTPIVTLIDAIRGFAATLS